MILWVSKHKNWLLMCVSLLFGTIAAFAINQHLDTKTREIESNARVPHVKRIVAARDLPRAAIIRMEDLAAHDFPTAWTTTDAIPVSQAESLVGKQLSVDLKAGQLLHWANTSEKPAVALSGRLPPGMRAITIPVDQINSLSGLVSPTDLIDLYVSFEHQGRRVTSTLLSGIEVLATGRQLNSPDQSGASHQDHFATLTLATSPEDAVKLVAARQTGTITAVLAQHNDNLPHTNINNMARGHLAGLLGMESPGVKAVPILYGDRMSGDDLQAAATQLGSHFSTEIMSNSE
jgi:pilus assembly protein CpaB